MAKAKTGWGGQPFVAAQAFNDTSAAAARLYVQQWRADHTVQVRQFQRSVRGGGAALMVTMVVVRRKVAAQPAAPAVEKPKTDGLKYCTYCERRTEHDGAYCRVCQSTGVK